MGQQHLGAQPSTAGRGGPPPAPHPGPTADVRGADRVTLCYAADLFPSTFVLRTCPKSQVPCCASKALAGHQGGILHSPMGERVNE